MKQNVDLTEKGHFSEGWMQGGWRAKGVFRKRKPIQTSKKFKEILKMNGKNKEYFVSPLVAKLFGIKPSPILWNGNYLIQAGQILGDTSLQYASTTAVSTNSIWIPTVTV